MVEFLTVSSNNSRPPQGMSPDAYAKQYAQQKGISVSEAKAELKAMHGDPAKQGGAELSSALSGSGNTKTTDIPPEVYQQLLSLGVPAEIIQQGDDAIRKYAKENNINIPAKSSGANVDFSS